MTFEVDNYFLTNRNVIVYIFFHIIFFPSKSWCLKSTTSILLAKSNTTQAEGETITSSEITLNQNLVSTYSELLKTDTVLTQVINNLNIRKCQTIIMHNGEISLNRLTILMDRTKTKISMFFRMNDLIEEK